MPKYFFVRREAATSRPCRPDRNDTLWLKNLTLHEEADVEREATRIIQAGWNRRDISVLPGWVVARMKEQYTIYKNYTKEWLYRVITAVL